MYTLITEATNVGLQAIKVYLFLVNSVNQQLNYQEVYCQCYRKK